MSIILNYDSMKYERVFQILKNKIECGLLPAGSSLPSRQVLSREFQTSEKTIRHALAKLEEEGLIQTQQRKRPVVSRGHAHEHQVTKLAMKKIDTTITNDLLQTGVLLCYPVIKNGIALCEQEDLKIPRRILENLDVENGEEFWVQTKRFLRFFIARNENNLSLSTVDSLGLEDLKPMKDTAEIRSRLYEQLDAFLQIIERGDPSESAYFDDLSELYGLTYAKQPAFRVPADSAVIFGREDLEKPLAGAELRYSAVYMDLLSLIAMGRYLPGDKLPSHLELQKIYNVSVDTTSKAIQLMQEWGIVKTVRGNGIYVEMDLAELRKIQIPADLIAYHVRRYLDSLELLVLTIEGAAACAVPNIRQEEITKVKEKMDQLWNEEYLYERTPAILLDFITEHLRINAFQAIYKLLQRNFRIGRSIPALLDTNKTPVNTRIHEQCVVALDTLSEGRQEVFPGKAYLLFEDIRSLVIQECKRLGYYEAAMEVYDGSSLWK